MIKNLKYYLLSLICFGLICSSSAQINQDQVKSFARDLSGRTELSYDQVMAFIDQAEYQSSIVEKISNPAEKTMTWGRYRNIFMKDERIEAGVDFWNQYSNVLSDVSADSGVPEEIILGIIGVETFFGQRKGGYKVLDALYTLAFGYPKRAKFFKSELGHFLEIVQKEGLDINEMKGSYAGALGYCQFMPSSYKAYAKSYDAGGTKDLVNSPEDAIASVANYLKVHRWKRGQRTVCEASKSDNAKQLSKQSLRPKNPVSYYNNLGYKPEANVSPGSTATLLQLENASGMEYWFGFNNFYVITRYNHSELYAMAVIQLAEAIKEKKASIR